MAEFIKKQVVVEAITFEEFVEYGKKHSENLVDGMPWSFEYKGQSVTHENDELYLIPTLEGEMRFTPEDVLITGVDGEIYPCKITIFEKTYSPAKTPSDVINHQISKLTFGQAVEAMKAGKCVAREGWNGKGMFIFMRPSDNIDCDTIINKIKSLPESVKKYYVGKFAHTAEEESKGIGPKDTLVHFTSYFCMKASDDTIVNGWLASQTDMASEDWVIVNN